MTDITYIRTPPFRVERRVLSRCIDASGLGHWQIVRFEVELSWIRIVHASAIVRGPAGVVGEGSTNNDFHGFCASIGGAIEDVPGLKRGFAIAPGVRLSVEIEAQFRDTPFLALPENESLGGLAYRAAGEDWRLNDPAQDEAWLKWSWGDEVDPRPPLLAPKPEAALIVWSSKDDAAQREERLRLFRERALRDFPAGSIEPGVFEALAALSRGNDTSVAP